MKIIIRVWGTLFIALVLFTISSPAQPPLPPFPPGISDGGGSGHSHGDSAPGVPGGGSGSGTNDGGVTFSPPIYDTNAFYLEALQFGTNAYNADSNSLTLLLHNTIADVAYQIWSTTNLQGSNTVWVVEQNLIGSEITNFTPATIPLTGDPQKYFKAMAYTLDSDGDGLPDWWENLYGLDPNDPDTGSTGVPDGDKQDSVGDGYNNLQKYQMGIPPGTWVTPQAPTAFNAIFNTNGTSAILTWSASPGSVASYTLLVQTNYFDGFNIYGTGFFVLTNVPASQTSFTDSSSTFTYGAQYQIQANYAGGSSSASDQTDAAINPAYGIPVFIVRGSQNQLYLVASSVPSNILAFHVFTVGEFSYFQYPIIENYNLEWQTMESGESTVDFTVPVSSLTNGVCQIAASNVPPYGTYSFEIQAIGVDGKQSPISANNPFQNPWGEFIPFLDGRTQIQQNIDFLFRSATGGDTFSTIFSYPPGSGYTTWEYGYSAQTNYVYSGYYTLDPDGYECNEFQPFEENYFYQNFVYNASNVDDTGFLTTGPSGGRDPYQFSLYGTAPSFLFPTYAYVTNPSQPPITGVLSDAAARWILYRLSGFSDGIGLSETSGILTVSSTCRNYYGLSLNSILYFNQNTVPATLATADAGTTFADPGFSPYYYEFATPVLNTVGYYFPRPGVDPQPGDSSFTVTNATVSPMIIPFGQPFLVAAWAQQSLSNGYSGSYAYPQQYFDKAFLGDTNGNITTNQTGILSEYGDFFPTQPGKVFLTTKPDAATGSVGTNEINVIKLQTDVNNDGVMDTSFAGQDNTSANRPFIFWVNNNYDRWHTVDGTDSEQDDLLVADCPYTIDHDAPDCEYRNFSGNREIPSTRDLEDFARLWVIGVSNCLSALPSGSTVTLSWGDVDSPNTNNPTIDLFSAADADGSMGYLTNSTIATNQIDPTISPYIGRLGPGQSIQLNACEFGNCWRGDHFIWCGVARGNGALLLTIADGSGNVLAQTTLYIQLKDIKEMYERYTVGDNSAIVPTSTAHLAGEGLPPGVMPFQYSPPAGTNTPYILHVHGSNMKLWEKDRFAETMYKRLYWQGYQGRFGSFRWPSQGTVNSTFDALTQPSYFYKEEYTSWLAAPGLKILLAQLNSLYPGQVRLSSHSMGNVAAQEALKQSTNGYVVSVYTPFQGAVASHSYNSSAPIRLLGLLDQDEPDTYAHYYTSNSPSYFYNVGGAAKYANFYNTNDFVLLHWNTGQNLKPYPSTYVYSGGEYYRNVGNLLSFPGDTYELFAFCVQAPCFCIGEEASVGGVFGTTNNVDLAANPYNFGDAHKGHSAQFRSDNQSRWPFYSQLMTTFQVRQTQ